METQGRANCHDLKHPSGEIGCRGFLPSTWRLYADIVIGYVPERTPTNETYVTQKMIQRWLDNGKTEREIFLSWNQGNHNGCRKGTNSHGVKYDSCAYAAEAIALLNQ